MAKAPGFVGESGLLRTYEFGGSITTGGTAQLILPQQLSRSYLLVANTSDTDMSMGIGPATAVATITSGAVASIAVVNAGFGYTYPPLVRIQGGLAWDPMIAQALGSPFGIAPTGPNLATAHATLSAGAVNAVTVDNGGAGYNAAPQAPYVYLENDPRDPFGCFAPSLTTGIPLPHGGVPFVFQNSVVPTDPISIFCATSAKTFVCKVIV